jgi:sensor c-di-GMP phosphodiesterase-like protein
MSCKQLITPQFVTHIQDALNKVKSLQTTCLGFTETVFLQTRYGSIRLGIMTGGCLYIDDFGIGYSA